MIAHNITWEQSVRITCLVNLFFWIILKLIPKTLQISTFFQSFYMENFITFASFKDRLINIDLSFKKILNQNLPVNIFLRRWLYYM